MISPPIQNFSWKRNVTQLFGVNPATYKQFNNEDGESLPGHNGLDIIIPDDERRGYGKAVLAMHNATVRQIETDFPIKKRGNGIYLLQKLDSGKYLETTYWHLSDFDVKVGDEVKVGDVIGKIGNTGYVKPEPSKNCPYCGSHLHVGVRFYGTRGEFIKTGYNGYVDPTPLLFKGGNKLPITIYRDLMIGKSGDDVSWLQTLLKLEGLAQDYEPLGYFGIKTHRDVIKLQQKYNLTPTIGYVGPKTRWLLMDKYA